jgi:plasmid stabilization system protein ParE
MVTVWTSHAKAALRQAYDYIYQDSPKNAAKVIADIVDQTIELTKNPGFFPPDKYKSNNDGNWRAFELHKYRISYWVTSDAIVIVRMRHTSRTPRSY